MPGQVQLQWDKQSWWSHNSYSEFWTISRKHIVHFHVSLLSPSVNVTSRTNFNVRICHSGYQSGRFLHLEAISPDKVLQNRYAQFRERKYQSLAKLKFRSINIDAKVIRWSRQYYAFCAIAHMYHNVSFVLGFFGQTTPNKWSTLAVIRVLNQTNLWNLRPSALRGETCWK